MKRRHGQLFYGMAASIVLRRRHREMVNTTTTKDYQPYEPQCPLMLNSEFGGEK
ncbi:MAG: hypothetical protein WBB37_00475 [bacterium]